MHANTFKSTLIWCALGIGLFVPMVFALSSPLLAWRDATYIVAGFSGVLALALLLVQPLLALGVLPGLAGIKGRRVHRWIGAFLGLCVVVHVAGLWITSPPDVIDALLLRSPTRFSLWGVIAMWALFATTALVVLRRRLRLRPRVWTHAHIGLAILIVAGSIAHALLIEGTMEPISKALLCLCVALAGLRVVQRSVRRVGS